jgi:hypothetical protein
MHKDKKNGAEAQPAKKLKLTPATIRVLTEQEQQGVVGGELKWPWQSGTRNVECC